MTKFNKIEKPTMYKASILALLFLVLSGLLACSADGIADGLADSINANSQYHTEGWSKVHTHGHAYIKDMDGCKACHGSKLDGGLSDVSCSTCHGTTGGDCWADNCISCHGDNTSPEKLSKAHNAHAVKDISCAVCHLNPKDDLDEITGKLKDNVADNQEAITNTCEHINGQADINFASTAGADAIYENSTCTVACHGNKPLKWSSDEQLGCATCHGDWTSLDRLSASHQVHMAEGSECIDCHNDVMNDSLGIKDADKHNNGEVDISFAKDSSIGLDAVYNNGSCSTTYCHGSGEPSWFGQAMDCNSCHNYKSEPENGSAAHASHINSTELHDGFACEECHVLPNSTKGHINGKADVNFASATLSPNGNYQDSSCQTTYCHGNNKIAWTESMAEGCTACHGDDTNTENMSGFHDLHLSIYGLRCNYCHTGVVNENKVITGTHLHVDGKVTVDLITGSFDKDTATCATACHNEDKTWLPREQWTCNSCHGDDTLKTDTLSGKHAAHLALGHTCNYCHVGIVTNDKEISDEIKHINGEADVRLLSGDYDPANHTCTKTCHSETRRWR